MSTQPTTRRTPALASKQDLKRMYSQHSEAEGNVVREAYLNNIVPGADAIALVNASRELIVAQEALIRALTHDLTTVEGLYAMDKAPVADSDAFRLSFQLLQAVR